MTSTLFLVKVAFLDFSLLEKVIFTVHSNTIYPCFLSKTKPKLVILYSHCSRCLSSLLRLTPLLFGHFGDFFHNLFREFYVQ